MAKPDLNKLKTEIDNRKRDRGILSEQKQGANLMPKDEFLNGLLTSLNTGQPTHATNLIKLVENKTAAKHGEVVRHTIDNNIQSNFQQQKPQQNKRENMDMSPERDELLWEEIEKRKKQTLTEQLETMSGKPVNNGMSQQRSQMNLNEGYLVENVKKIVDNYLVDNFGPIVEEAIKSTILELYAVDRIKEVLYENKELLRGAVIDVIKEIQAKKKAQ